MFGAVQYNMTHSTVHCSAVQDSSVKFSLVQYSTMFSTVQCSQFSKVLCSEAIPSQFK